MFGSPVRIDTERFLTEEGPRRAWCGLNVQRSRISRGLRDRSFRPSSIDAKGRVFELAGPRLSCWSVCGWWRAFTYARLHAVTRLPCAHLLD